MANTTRITEMANEKACLPGRGLANIHRAWLSRTFKELVETCVLLRRGPADILSRLPWHPVDCGSFEPRHWDRRRGATSRAVRAGASESNAARSAAAGDRHRTKGRKLSAKKLRDHHEQSGFSTSELGSDGFHDAQRAGRRQNALQAQASASKELLELIPRSRTALRQAAQLVQSACSTGPITKGLPMQ